MMRFFVHLFRNLLWSLASVLLLFVFFGAGLYVYLASRLPEVATLKDINLQVPLHVYSSDNKLIGEFGEKKRQPISIDKVPKTLIQAVLATEDQRFYEHPGVDFIGLIRAAFHLIITGNKGQGGGTITMQVARNFYLSPEKTYFRKINELLLAIKIDHELTKDKILELYLNKIYFGYRAYGIVSAAYVYYGKTLDQLNLSEIAMLAGLPQAPSRINPLVNKDAAVARRNHVLARMLDLGYIDNKTYRDAINTVEIASYHALRNELHADYVGTMVRDSLINNLGVDVFNEGLNVYTTIDSHLQEMANIALRNGLLAFEERHGYRGPEKRLGDKPIQIQLQQLKSLVPINSLLPALVREVKTQEIIVQLADDQLVTIPWEGLVWAKPEKEDFAWSPAPKTAKQIVQIGDIVRVRQLESKWRLAQIPKVGGALVSIDPKDGKILALVGGFDYQLSNFNRASQSKRQPGSNFKPFVYAAALTKGFTLATMINDAPIVIQQPDGTWWRPQNNTKRFYGPTRIREGLVESRNLVSIRLLQLVGLPYALNYLRNFGFDPKELPNGLSLALGTAELTPISIASAYTVFANGGYLVTPHLIDNMKNLRGKTIYQADVKIACMGCTDEEAAAKADDAQMAPHTIDTSIAYLMTTVLKDVILRGTGRKALTLQRSDIAGKTGTTNDKFDAWFSGFNSDVVTTVWVGFDQPKSLHEFGGDAALPIWIEYMRQALAGKPLHSLEQPEDVVTANINPYTGALTPPWASGGLIEYFRSDTMPNADTGNTEDGPQDWIEPGSDGSGNVPPPSPTPKTPEEPLF